MHFGAEQRKLNVVADFIEALGHSAYRSGDSVGLTAFDHECRDDLHAPARLGRGVGVVLAEGMRELQLRTPPRRAASDAFPALEKVLRACVDQLSHNSKLTFILSDFHWPEQAIASIMRQLQSHTVVPLIVWDRAEITPPEQGRWLKTREMESGQRRSLWLRPSVQKLWLDKVSRRRETLTTAFAKHQARPFFMDTGFHADALSRYFLEQASA